jgi:lysozyme
MKQIYWALLLAFLAMCALFGALIFFKYHNKSLLKHKVLIGREVSKYQYPITGIDISKHSGKIDWKKVGSHNLDFVYIKATEGESYVDPRFTEYVKGARSQDMTIGFYHFFRFNKNGEAQASNFMNRVGNYKNTLPPVLDVEEWGNTRSKRTTNEVKAEIKSFLKAVEDQIGRKMIIYTNESSYRRFIEGEFPNNPIWICTFRKEPKLPDRDTWLLWQHAHDGQLDGIEGFIDLNTFNGSKRQWQNYISNHL